MMDDFTDKRESPDTAGATAAELLQVGSDSLSVPFTMRLEPSGELSYSALTAVMQQFLRLPDGETDLATFMSRMEQTAEDLAVQRRMFERSASDLEVFSFESRFRDGEGRPRWIRFVALPRREANGAIAWSGVMRDISEQKRAEDQVELFRAAMVQSEDAILIIESNDPETRSGTILYANPAFETLSAIPVIEIIGKPVAALRSFQPSAETNGRIRAMVASNDHRTLEYQITKQDGLLVWVETHFAVVQRFTTGSYRIVFIMRNICDRKQAELELRKAKEAAEAASLAKGE